MVRVRDQPNGDNYPDFEYGDAVTNFPDGTRSPFARAIAAEVRALLAVRRVGLRPFASEAGFDSHNYVAIRLRDEKPFTLDDVDRICGYFEEDPIEFVARADRNHRSRYESEAVVATHLAMSDVEDHLRAFSARVDLLAQKFLERAGGDPVEAAHLLAHAGSAGASTEAGTWEDALELLANLVPETDLTRLPLEAAKRWHEGAGAKLLGRGDLDLAAHEEQHTIEAEQEGDEFP